MLVIKQNKIWKDAIGIECNTKKKFCVLQKKFLSFGHSESSAEQFCQTELSVGHYSPYAVVKFIYFEKVTIFCKIFAVDLTVST